MSYRDDHEASLNRVTALERELRETRSSHADDVERIEQLERSLAVARQAIEDLRQGPTNLPHANGGFPQANGIPAPLPASGATTVLVFGILSLTICALFGPFAWHYGNVEIRKMDYGLVDASSRGSAVAGKVCGIIASCLMMAFAFFFLIGMTAAM